MARTNNSYDRETFVERVKEYIELRNLNYTIEEIKDLFLDKYGIKSIDSYRKSADLLKNIGGVEIKYNTSDAIEKISKAKANILLNRKINIQMNKELHKQANDNARWELIKQKLNEFKPEHTKFVLKNNVKKIKTSDKDVIYVIGDIHYRGEQDKELVITTFNKINFEVLKKGYKNITIILTGDNVDGEIHNEQQRTNDPVIDATMQMTNLLCECINCNPAIKQVYMVYGNHEEIRLWGDKGTTNNVGKFIYWGLKNCLKYAKVEAGEELLFDYKGKKVLLLHGHQNYAKSKAKIIEHCAVQYKTQPDYIILGHFHTSKANQFSKNHWLITAPALKNWESEWDKNNGYCGLGQYIKLKLNYDTPQITTINTEEKHGI